MRDLYGDEYASVADPGSDGLIPDSVRKLAGAAVFLGLILAMGLWAYSLGTRDATEVPIIRAMEGPARVQPEDPGGLQAAHQGLEVNAVLASEPAPQPRDAVVVPAPAALAEEDAPQGELVLAAPAALTEIPVEGTGDLRMPTPEEAPETIAAEPESTPLEPLSVETALAAPPVTDLAAAGAAPAMRPRGRPANLAEVRASPPQPAAAASPAAATAAPAAAPREVAGLGRGTRLVQLGAFDSEGITRQAWEQLVARHGDLLGAKSLYVERTTSNARVFYRLRVAGFGNTEETRAMCEALKARSIDCIPVTLQ